MTSVDCESQSCKEDAGGAVSNRGGEASTRSGNANKRGEQGSHQERQGSHQVGRRYQQEGRRLVRKDLLEAPVASNLAFNEKVKGMQAGGATVYHFAFGQSPFPVPHCLVAALQQHAHRHEYLPVQGLPALRQAVVELHKREDRLALDAAHVVVGPGSKELIYLTLAVSTGVVLIPAPAWTTYAPQVRLAGLRVVVAPTLHGLEWGYKICPSLLEESLHPLKGQNIFLILTNPGNPSGTCYSDAELKDLSTVCRRHGVVVLSDEIYARLKFAGDHSSIVKHYPEGSVLLSGFSKWASAGGWRLGYAHYSPQLAVLKEAVLAAASQTYSCAPAPQQCAVAQALTENYDELQRYAMDCARILRSVSDYSYRELHECGVAGTRSEAGYYFMPDFAPLRSHLNARGIHTGHQLTQAFLAEAKVAVMPSSNFLLPEDDLSTRFCFVCFDGSRALEALQAAEDAGGAEAGAVLGTADGSGTGTVSREFVERYCGPVVEGVQSLKRWVQQLKSPA